MTALILQEMKMNWVGKKTLGYTKQATHSIQHCSSGREVLRKLRKGSSEDKEAHSKAGHCCWDLSCMTAEAWSGGTQASLSTWLPPSSDWSSSWSITAMLLGDTRFFHAPSCTPLSFLDYWPNGEKGCWKTISMLELNLEQNLPPEN